ncbi:MAG: homocysteine S-methyltransferase family protein, partial [Actinomycetota bacterium]|nr:homocysteine S-methyltransferase family protein [Actinomycetota bacterium]
MAHSFLDAVRERVVIFDGATGTNLQVRELTADDYGGPELEGCPEILNVSRPDVIADLHRSFFEVGVDVVETNSFGALPWALDEYGLGDRTEELARISAEIAREVASGFDGFVAGSLGPTNKSMPSLGWIKFAPMRDGYELAARGLLAGGVDLFIIETVQD